VVVVIAFENGLYIRIEENDKGPAPFPLKSGFTREQAYRVLGIFNASESSEAYLILANDQDQLWFISNRHVRFVGISKEYSMPRFELPDELPFKDFKPQSNNEEMTFPVITSIVN